ncbi:uncharacterized protein M437DRAFT_75065 [Aureobasidium melanogenum CBS 110374]|uniref:Zn(2)-C6 fungal-type domain-containing protein n=1 Tax=Aureobasidium melanogenum (strain CBS 110374) TaxID=1043003 RepID=A0A074VZR9_AURM1|nr:uncharacterized protein M437DRAFT_75065 [Aureobasidium melanogenum CBS 110374]KEQ63177.1 hypothetical protein M437DRAFT_75065 [Aureobasidium melanogenum CBS 110374]
MGYPSFPGNVEALSLPDSPPGLYHSTSSLSSSSATTTPNSPPLRTTTQSQTPDTPNDSSKPRRRQTLAACRPCRKRKSRCDGARPRCNTCLDKATPCAYSVEEGKTQQQASREELKAYRSVVFMLRRASPPDTEVILRHLKQFDDVNEAVKSIETDMMLRGSSIST